MTARWTYLVSTWFLLALIITVKSLSLDVLLSVPTNGLLAEETRESKKLVGSACGLS